MNTKLLEIRDAGTFIPVLAVSMVSDDPIEKYLLSRVGYGIKRLILLTMLTANLSEYSYLGWAGGGYGRTMTIAHQWITDHWDEINTGDVIDVEWILGESEQPKTPERLMLLEERK